MEFNLSNYCAEWEGLDVILQDEVKEFIKLREKQNLHLQYDVIDLVNLNDGSKEDLIIKLNRLFLINKELRNQLAGDKLI